MTAAPQTAVWRNRIVRMGTIRAGDAQANEANWRVHPQSQQQALTGALNEVGWVTGVIVNLRSAEEWGRDQGVETIVDGHARIGEALRVSEDTEVPVIYVDLSPSEERLVLATFDPLSAMAIPDKAQLESLLQEVQTGDAAVMAMLEGLAEANGIVPEMSNPGDDPFSDFPEDGPAPDGSVGFQCGEYRGRVSKEVYESFTSAYREHRTESDAVLLDDVLRGWLDV